jgi:SM-20-related protein
LIAPEPQAFFLNNLADALGDTGYYIVNNAIPAGLVDRLWVELQDLPDDELKVAGIGRQDDFQLNRQIRRDKISWLDGRSTAQTDFLMWMQGVRQGLNQRLFMGLFDYECHYASYAPGAFYKKHFDAFKDQQFPAQSNRILSTVLYLNPGWQHGDGGELLIYNEEDTQLLEVVAPEYGKLVVFLSKKFPHEVKTTATDRQSVAGWFRTQPPNPIFCEGLTK